MAQEILPPERNALSPTSRREIELIDDSVSNLKSKINLIDRIRVGLRTGQKTAEMVAAMQNDVLQTQRDIVQHHARMIARDRKMQITDAYQAGISDLTRRVEDRVSTETKHYWSKIYERIDYYEEFFEARIRDLRKRIETGVMSKERGEARIAQCEADREKQIAHDQILLDELRDASARVLQRALEDYRPS